MNTCPVCRNVNQQDATVCRFCGTALTPPPPTPAAPPVRRRTLWPWLAGALALVLVVGVSGFAFFGGGGEQAAGGAAVTVGTDPGAALLFAPESVSVTAPPETEIQLTFTNQATVPHNLTFTEETGIQARTEEQLPPQQSQTITFAAPPPGTYPFVCTIHPGMDGTLVVQ